MTDPTRIRLRRTKGWRKPEGAVVVARPSRWGNPFRVGDRVGPVPDDERVRDLPHAVALFALHRATRGYPSDAEVRAALAGHDLACWCPLDQPCHADVLLEIANRKDRP